MSLSSSNHFHLQFSSLKSLADDTFQLHTRRRLFPISFAVARFLYSLGGGNTSTTDTLQTVSNQLCYRQLLGKSQQRNYIPIPTHRRLQPLNCAHCACFMGSPGGGHTSCYQYAVDRSTSPSPFRLASLAVQAEELHRKRVGRIIATHPFPCSSIIQTLLFLLFNISKTVQNKGFSFVECWEICLI